MYKNISFQAMPLEIIEEDLKELAEIAPQSKTIQLLSANPLALSYKQIIPRLELINKYIPNLEVIYTQTRVTDLKSKTVEHLKDLKNLKIK